MFLLVDDISFLPKYIYHRSLLAINIICSDRLIIDASDWILAAHAITSQTNDARVPLHVTFALSPARNLSAKQQTTSAA